MSELGIRHELSSLGDWPGEKCENEGSPGYIDENKQRKVSGVRCQGGDQAWVADPVGCRRGKCENEGSSGYVDEKKD